jgi:hypothetical protein
MPALSPVDRRPMNVSAVNSAMNGIAAAQGMFAGAAQAAANVGSPAAGSGDGSATEAVQVAVLQKALDMERGLVNILA